jgi:hypothetical protein
VICKVGVTLIRQFFSERKAGDIEPMS